MIPCSQTGRPGASVHAQRLRWSDRYPRISEAVAALRTASATIDGEGLAIFDNLHSRAYDGEVVLYAFDLLELDEEDWRPRPLVERKGETRISARLMIHFTICLKDILICLKNIPRPRSGRENRKILVRRTSDQNRRIAELRCAIAADATPSRRPIGSWACRYRDRAE
jgi:hypothetical protein